MNWVVLISGLVEIVLSLILGVLFIYAAFQVFSRLTKGIEEIEELKKNNTAVGILISSIILSVIYLIKGALDPAITVFSNGLRNPNITTGSFLETIGIMLAHVVISGLVGFAAIYIALIFFMWLTKDIDEMEEIKNNNVAVGIFMAVVVFAMALVLEPGVKTLLDALIPYPEFIGINR
jgi:uncharacterized membrane protein YjfL (UPF0719 family)